MQVQTRVFTFIGRSEYCQRGWYVWMFEKIGLLFTNVDVIWDNFLMDNLSLHIKSHKIFIFFHLEVLPVRNKYRSDVSLLLVTSSPLFYEDTILLQVLQLILQ